jgi:hypothetical protein
MRLQAVLKVPAVLLLLGVAAVAAAGAPSDPLWNKAVEITRASVDWVPGSASFVLQLVDEKGAAQDSWQSWYTLGPGTDGAVTMEVTKSTHNGDDTTAREQENQRKSKREPPTHWDNPFDPKVQSSVASKPTGKTELLDGRSCTLYDFSFTKADHSTLSGTAWLDTASGAPVQVRYTAAPLPRGVFSLTTTLRFTKGPAGDGFLQEAFVEGVGGILFIKRSFRSVVTVGAYWRPAPVSSPPASG